MNPFHTLSQTYKRWRHSRGFGVHSPFAYDLVKNAVAPGNYAFYGYDAIDRALLMPESAPRPHMRHDARLLLRLLVETGKTRLLIYPHSQPVARTTAAAAGIECDNLNIADPTLVRGSDIILVRDDIPGAEGVMPFIGAEAAVMALDPSKRLRRHINGAMSDGLILEGKRIVIAIPRKEMALTTYSMKL